ncbi:hypothetical protein M426DRAFT_8589 [Hypoxylon sp. CI-4A]|nr:hypothetical protein M426DRAFT_8589 [Hypoxylon sp. CI-4A]
MGNLQESLEDNRYRTTAVKNSVASLTGELDEVKKTTPQENPVVYMYSLRANRILRKRQLEMCQHLERMQEVLDRQTETAKANLSESKAHAEEIASLRAEVREPKEELSREQAQKSQPSVAVLPSRELDILTASITRIGQRASQVETLQMELELLKGRVQRMEKPQASNTQDAMDMGSHYGKPIHSLSRASA